jgi:DNA repair protein RecN (Recombination protein N)
MLRLLQIRNYAIIDQLEVEFGAGLNVLTGETGAGKSILVDALGLALGDRADQRSVRASAAKAEISVLFECPADHAALRWLREHDLEDDLSCSLRRVISKEGRSRAFVNNSPVTLENLRELGSTLIEIHGQQAHQSLMQVREQRRLLDAMAGNTELARRVAAAWADWQAAVEALQNFSRRQDDRLATLELLRFQLTELEQLDLVEGEVESLLSEHHRLANIEDIAQSAQTALRATYEGDSNAQALLAKAIEALASAGAQDAQLAAIAEQLRNAEIEVRDAGISLSHYCDSLEPDSDRLADLDSRLGRIRTLAKRHHVDDTALWEKTVELQDSIEQMDDSQASEAQLERRISEAREAFMAGAGKLSKARQREGRKLSAEVTDQLPNLGLRDGRFRVELTERNAADSTGIDDIEFQVQLNAGQGFGALARVASGGELSRISLALQVASGGRSTVPTFVFDEIDTGIGGGAAEIVGARLRELAADRQVLCVTHQAQVASQGHTHFRIAKTSDGKSSRVAVQPLDAAERVEELSRMIGGIEITDKARAHAEEMVARAAGT